MPPKPGTTSEASLAPQSRLISDSARSPSTPATPTTTPNSAASRYEPNSPHHKKPRPTDAPTDVASPPARPSHVFFGLNFGVIGCRPKNLPTKYAPTSPPLVTA